MPVARARPHPAHSIAGFIQRLRRDCSGLALIEFAYTMPIMLMVTFGGIELANYAVTHLRISQFTTSLADNASRAKQAVTTGNPRFREYDVQEVFAAAQLQSGALDLAGNGRAILSSLEVNADGGQWIHWQRCYGGKTTYTSSYGVEGDGATGKSITSIGPTGHTVAAEPDFAIMFVEVYYEYKSTIWSSLVPPQTIRKTAAMYVRDSRDLSQIYNPAPTVTPLTC